MPAAKRKELGHKAKEYVNAEFKHETMVDQWHESLVNIIDEWKTNPPKRWELKELKS